MAKRSSKPATAAEKPETRLSFVLHRVNAGLSRVSNPLFRQYGLDAITSRILVIVLNRRVTYVGDVIDALALPQSTVSHQIKRLERAEYVRREQDPIDNRSFKVQLTPRGRRVARACDLRSQKLNRVMVESLSDDQRGHFFEELQALITLLNSLDPADLVLPEPDDKG